MRKESYKTQEIVSGPGALQEAAQIAKNLGAQNILAVCSRSARKHCGEEFWREFPGKVVFFHEFSPNPKYEEVEAGLALYEKERCGMILSMGGGSAMDVAKCIKMFLPMDRDKNYLKQEKKAGDIKHIAIPSTAGTGSESTSFAVVYYQGEKQSVAHPSLLPDYAVLHAEFLEHLPLYQKKATMLDALCQAIESYWSVNSTEESRGYARQAIAAVRESWPGYVQENTNWRQIMEAANLAGRAINISKTTAAHAMSYKITSMYGFAHGHAAAICLPGTWAYLQEHIEDCTDSRGKDYLLRTLVELSQMLGKENTEESVAWFTRLIDTLELPYPVESGEEDIEILSSSVNAERLNNFPVKVTKEALRIMYRQIVKEPQ